MKEWTEHNYIYNYMYMVISFLGTDHFLSIMYASNKIFKQPYSEKNC
jgi:hypothetical protein